MLLVKCGVTCVTIIKTLGNTPGHCGTECHAPRAGNDSVMPQASENRWWVSTLAQWPCCSGNCTTAGGNQVNWGVFLALLCSKVNWTKGCRNAKLPVMVKENRKKHSYTNK